MPDYEVFVQLRRDQPLSHVGSVRAASDDLALHAAKEIHTRRESPVAMWVVERAHIHTFDGADRDLFEIAGAKEYRLPSYFTKRYAQLNGGGGGRELEALDQ